MITGAIAVVFVIGMIGAAGDGQWGSVAVGAVIVVLVLLFGAEGRKCDRAFNNFVDYWANKGKDESKERTYKRMKDMDASQVRWREKDVTTGIRAREGAVKCGQCGRVLTDADIASRMEYGSGAKFASYRCPGCGEQKLVKL